MDYMMLCSRCLTPCSKETAHVIPWWVEEVDDFNTIYRCDNCWLTSLDETAARIEDWDSDTCGKFCEFIERHKLHEIAAIIRRKSLQEASRIAIGLLDMLRRGKIWLYP